MAEHKRAHIAVISITFIAFWATVFFGSINNLPFGREIGLFEGNPSDENLADEFYTEVNPPPWVFFVIWPIIFLWQAIWQIYGLSLICRRNSTFMAYLYIEPYFMPIAIYFAFCFALISNVAWIFTFDRGYIGISLGVIAVSPIALIVAVGISARALYTQAPALLRMGHEREIALVRGLVQNGLAFYATWTAIATHLSLSSVLTYEAGLDQRDASSIVLGMLGVFVILYSTLDLLAIDKYTRYIVTPYFVLLFALTGILLEIGGWPERNFIVTTVLLGLSGFAFVFKMAAICCKLRYDPDPLKRETA